MIVKAYNDINIYKERWTYSSFSSGRIRF